MVAMQVWLRMASRRFQARRRARPRPLALRGVRNGKLTPTDATSGHNKAVWWRSGCGHVFELKVFVWNKAKKPSCPYCSGRKAPKRTIENKRELKTIQ